MTADVELLMPGEAARLLNVDTWTLSRWADEHTTVRTTPGGARRYDAEPIYDLLGEPGADGLRRPLLTTAEVAERFGVHPATVRRWVKRGLVNEVRLGQRDPRYRAADIDALMGGAPSPSTPEDGSTDAR
jgi:excisionase family DNA binding protein